MSLKICKNAIKAIIFLSLICLDKKYFLSPVYIHPFYLKKKPIILKDKKQNETLTKGRKFLDKCLNIPNNNTYKYIKKPRASVIMPLYNCQETIEYSIRSIQYQNMTKVEIILVNDFSTDNTSKIIREIQKNDERIKIIDNQRNKGTLYSRSVGVLLSKGKYIFSLDNDDMYFDYDVFDTMCKKLRKTDLDAVGFLTVNLYNYTDDIDKMKNIYSYQYKEDLFLNKSRLPTWIIKFKGKFLVHNNMIWDKCIKSKLYKSAIYKMGISRIIKNLSWAEDTSIVFLIFKLAKSFLYVHKYGMAHFKGNSTATYTQSIESKIFGDIFFLDIIFDYTKNNIKEKNLIVGQAIYIYKRYGFHKFTNDANSIYLRFVLNKIFNCKYLNKLNRRKITKIFSEFFTNN
jgi:glycosyltransferase involved in cell wall biosynthesis